jgi:hypothetical protein
MADLSGISGVTVELAPADDESKLYAVTGGLTMGAASYATWLITKPEDTTTLEPFVTEKEMSSSDEEKESGGADATERVDDRQAGLVTMLASGREKIKHAFKSDSSYIKVLEAIGRTDGQYACCTVATICIDCIAQQGHKIKPKVILLRCTAHRKFDFPCHQQCSNGKFTYGLNGMCGRCNQDNSKQKKISVSGKIEAPGGAGAEASYSSDTVVPLRGQ